MVIIQGKQDYCDITITDAAGNVIPYGAPESWEAVLYDFLRHTVVKCYKGADIEETANENASFRIFIDRETTASMEGRHDLQIKAVFATEKNPIDIAKIENFLNVQEGY